MSPVYLCIRRVYKFFHSEKRMIKHCSTYTTWTRYLKAHQNVLWLDEAKNILTVSPVVG